MVLSFRVGQLENDRSSEISEVLRDEMDLLFNIEDDGCSVEIVDDFGSSYLLLKGLSKNESMIVILNKVIDEIIDNEIEILDFFSSDGSGGNIEFDNLDEFDEFVEFGSATNDM